MECPPGIPGSSGSAARFFYCSKASRSDRGETNKHPTVKPTNLMRWLCRLITPPGGIVLDCFTGSGSTGKAAILEGFRFVGFEREREYFDEACGRIAESCETAARPQQREMFAAT
jgi:DNA modification methylase